MGSMSSASADQARPRPEADAYYLTRSALLNRCNLSPWALASQAFQEDPRPLEIAWIHQENQGFFDMLARIGDEDERSALFHEYALSRFWLGEDRARWPDERERLRHSYVSVLRGWGMDSNGASGAVFKGWAEDRFGLRAIWHQEALGGGGQAHERYASDRMRGALAGIAMQLDLLFTYCQSELRRRHGGQRWLTLYRGTHDPEAYTVKEPSAAGHGVLVEFNTVSSFTSDREIAWEFGSQVWEVRVPLAKIVYFSGLLARNLLQGEREFIVLGGDYRATPLAY